MSPGRAVAGATAVLAMLLATGCGGGSTTTAATASGAASAAPLDPRALGGRGPIPPDHPGWWVDHLPASPAPPVTTFVSDELFGFNQATLLPRADAALSRALGVIGRGPGPVFELTAHADLVGCEGPGQVSACISLTARRAEVTRQFFIDRGVPPDRLTARGAGALDPLTVDPADQARNRRIELRRS